MAQGVHGNPRGTGIATFGPDITAAFCRREGVAVVIRSHQYVREGVKFMHGGRLITVFSARNYLGAGSANDGGLLLVAPDEEGNLRIRSKRILAMVEKRWPLFRH